MTPFGEALRKLRERKGVTQKEMAEALHVTPAYLSALEHGKRGLPTFAMLQRIAGYFNIIWDEAEDLFMLARSSDPRIVIDTSGMAPEYTALANRLAGQFRQLSREKIEALNAILDNAQKTS